MKILFFISKRGQNTCYWLWTSSYTVWNYWMQLYSHEVFKATFETWKHTHNFLNVPVKPAPRYRGLNNIWLRFRSYCFFLIQWSHFFSIQSEQYLENYIQMVHTNQAITIFPFCKDLIFPLDIFEFILICCLIVCILISLLEIKSVTWWIMAH